MTPSRVVAFSCVGVSDEEDRAQLPRLVVRGKERCSWPREQVSVHGFPGEAGATDGLGELTPAAYPCR